MSNAERINAILRDTLSRTYASAARQYNANASLPGGEEWKEGQAIASLAFALAAMAVRS